LERRERENVVGELLLYQTCNFGKPLTLSRGEIKAKQGAAGQRQVDHWFLYRTAFKPVWTVVTFSSSLKRIGMTLWVSEGRIAPPAAQRLRDVLLVSSDSIRDDDITAECRGL